MFLKDLEAYAKSLPNLRKLEPTLECTEDYPDFFVVKTKETYVFEDESEADDRINLTRSNPGFAGVDKKYKAAKINKNGEVTRPETWTVVAKLNHVG